MTDDLLLTTRDYANLSANLVGGETEMCAVLLCSRTERSDGRSRFLTGHVIFPETEDYSYREKLGVELRPAFVARVAKVAARTGNTLVFVHSHPGSNAPRFSPIDDDGEAKLAIFFNGRTPSVRHLSLVVSEGGACCRFLGTERYLRVITLGDDRRVVADPQALQPDLGRHDRQIRAFGKAAQTTLESLRIAVVGLGGTGSIIAQQLVHLGVSDFIFTDPDVVETSNLN